MMKADPYVTSQHVRDICERLERIADALGPIYLVQDAVAAQREADKAAWHDYFRAALTGLAQRCTVPGNVESAAAHADAALAALHSRWPEPQKDQQGDDHV